MSSAERQLMEDKALRDAALAVFLEDIRLIKADLGARGVSERIADRFGESAQDMLDEAIDYAEANKGQMAAAVAAIALWFARGPILRLLADLFGLSEDEPEQVDSDGGYVDE